MPTARLRPRKPSSDVIARPVEVPADGTPAVGFLGLGIMGTAMSNNLLKAGFEVSGFDPSEAARKRFTRSGGRPSASAAEMAQHAEVIITSLPHARALI